MIVINKAELYSDGVLTPPEFSETYPKFIFSHLRSGILSDLDKINIYSYLKKSVKIYGVIKAGGGILNKRVTSKVVKEAALKRLEERGVTLEDISKIVYDMQIVYNKNLTMDLCCQSVNKVLEKREVQHAILVGVELDVLAEKKLLQEPLQSLVESDEGLFGIDETIALGSVFGYGSIAVTTFGYLDKDKIGIIKKLDTKNGTAVNTFLDDLVAGIAASASGRIAHNLRDFEEAEEEKVKIFDNEDLENENAS